MKLRRWVCFLLCLVLTVCLCTPALADGELFFVAVNDTIPLTLSVFPTYSGGTLYVPYQVFDSQPCGVTPSYNQTKQTYVLLSRTRQMIFDLAAGTVSDESGSVSTAAVFSTCRSRSAPHISASRPRCWNPQAAIRSCDLPMAARSMTIPCLLRRPKI